MVLSIGIGSDNMKSPVKSVIGYLSQFSIYDWLRFIVTILCNICAIYTVFYGLTHFYETHSIAFIATGFLSFFTIYRLYGLMKGEDVYERENAQSKRVIGRKRP